MWRGRRTSCMAWVPKSERCIRLGPIFHGSGLDITVMSLSGKLNVGIISCRQLVDDLWDLADRFEIELDNLLGSRTRPLV